MRFGICKTWQIRYLDYLVSVILSCTYHVTYYLTFYRRGAYSIIVSKVIGMPLPGKKTGNLIFSWEGPFISYVITTCHFKCCSCSMSVSPVFSYGPSLQNLLHFYYQQIVTLAAIPWDFTGCVPFPRNHSNGHLGPHSSNRRPCHKK